MLKEKITFKREKAVVLTVDIGYNTEAYALAWLKLTNNAREYPDMIWKIKNNRHDDTVLVFCNPKYAKNVKDFCDEFISYFDRRDESIHYIGKVISEHEEIVGIPVYEYESTCDTNDPQWEEDIESSIFEWMGVVDAW